MSADGVQCSRVLLPTNIVKLLRVSAGDRQPIPQRRLNPVTSRPGRRGARVENVGSRWRQDYFRSRN